MPWPCYLINLAENSQRLRNCEDQFHKQGLLFERIEGVNGWKMSQAEIEAAYDPALNKRRYKLPLVPAEIGCYLSHRKACGRIAEGDSAGGFIFEDDLKAAADLAPILEALSTDPLDDWDMVKLFAFDQNLKVLGSRFLMDQIRIVQPYKIPTCLIGYALTQEGAQKLMSRSVKIFRPVDEDQKFFWETGLKISCVLPSPIVVGEEIAVTDTIGNARRAAAIKKGKLSVSRAVRGIMYQVYYKSLLFYHRKLKSNVFNANK